EDDVGGEQGAGAISEPRQQAGERVPSDAHPEGEGNGGIQSVGEPVKAVDPGIPGRGPGGRGAAGHGHRLKHRTAPGKGRGQRAVLGGGRLSPCAWTGDDDRSHTGRAGDVTWPLIPEAACPRTARTTPSRSRATSCFRRR